MAKDRDNIQPLIDDDALLDDLSRGIDPSSGEDPLAAMLLGLRAEVEAPMPPAPLPAPEVIDLHQARAQRRPNRWLHGLVGFSAGVVLVAGGGVLLGSAGPTSPLYAARTAVFGPEDTPQVVELAGTLDELEDRTDKGDLSGAKELINKARQQLDKANNSGPAVIKTTVVKTETLTVTPPAPTPEPPVVTTVYVTPTPTPTLAVTTTETTEEETTPETTVLPAVTAPVVETTASTTAPVPTP